MISFGYEFVLDLDGCRDGRLPMREEIPPRKICVAYLRRLTMSAAAREMTDRLREVRLS